MLQPGTGIFRLQGEPKRKHEQLDEETYGFKPQLLLGSSEIERG